MMKAYTDLEQSKKLEEFLPIESADMSWVSNGLGKPFVRTIPLKGHPEEICGCWSLAALLEVIPEVLAEKRLPDAWDCVSYAECQMTSANNFENLIDACVEVILKLHEQEFL